MIPIDREKGGGVPLGKPSPSNLPTNSVSNKEKEAAKIPVYREITEPFWHTRPVRVPQKIAQSKSSSRPCPKLKPFRNLSIVGHTISGPSRHTCWWNGRPDGKNSSLLSAPR